MGLILLPERISGSLGPTKTDSSGLAYSTNSLFASEWNVYADGLVGAAAEIGLSDGSTENSLVARKKEYINLDYYGTASMALSNTLPNPAYNSGWINAQLNQRTYTNTFTATIATITADGISGGFASAVWWFDQTVPFGKYNISFNVGTNLDNPNVLPGGPSDTILIGAIYASDVSASAGLIHGVGSSAGNWNVWKLAISSDSGIYGGNTNLGGYFSKTFIELFGYKHSGSNVSFYVYDNQIDIYGSGSVNLYVSTQMLLTQSSWVQSDLNRVGIILLGSSSIPFTMSIYDFRVYPRHGDPGYAR